MSNNSEENNNLNNSSNNIPRDSDVKLFSVQTIAMLEPILTNKQFTLASLKMQKIQQKISPEDYGAKKKELEKEIYCLQKRIVREVDVLAKLK